MKNKPDFEKLRQMVILIHKLKNKPYENIQIFSPEMLCRFSTGEIFKVWLNYGSIYSSTVSNGRIVEFFYKELKPLDRNVTRKNIREYFNL